MRARCNINGRLRLKVEVTLVNRMATDNPLLQAIIGKNLTSGPHPRSLVSLAPLILNFAKAKAKLLMTHVIAPNYSNWDLDVVFESKEWTIQWVGYLHLEEFEELNRGIGRGEVSENELAAQVRRHQHLLPLTAVDQRKLQGYPNVCQSRAAVIEELVQRHQMRGQPKPLSLITLYTPAGLLVTDEEQFLRERAISLGETKRSGISCVDAIVQITQVLLGEGLNNLQFEEDDARRLRDELRPFLTKDLEVDKALLLYHLLVWKTSGVKEWTMAREPGETHTQGYLPSILDACGLPMLAEICSSDDDLFLPREGSVSEELRKVLVGEEDEDEEESTKSAPDTEDWQEVSLLEFVNSTLPPDKVAPVRGSSSQPSVQVVTSKDRVLAWRKAVDSDNHRGDSVFEVDGSENMFVRSNTDIRVLYEKLPESMRTMCLAQLLKEYLLLHPSKNGYVSSRSSIDEESGVGPASEGIVAGTDIAAPQSIKLTDGRIMKRRQGVNAVPLLLHTGTVSRHGNQLLFEPWRHLEDVNGIQEEEETESQRRRRLEIFPCSLIPFAADENENDNA